MAVGVGVSNGDVAVNQDRPADGSRNGQHESSEVMTGRHAPESRGLIVGVGLPTVLQMLQLERASCLLRVSTGDHEGSLALVDGTLFDAETEGDTGEAAVYRILTWRDTRIEMSNLTSDVDRKIHSTLAFLLMDAVRRVDEHASGDAESPVMEPNELIELLLNDGEVVDESKSQQSDGLRGKQDVADDSYLASLPSNLAERLAVGHEITGLVVMVLVDGKAGAVLTRVEGGESFDVEQVLAPIDAVVRSEIEFQKRFSQESLNYIVITLTTQYHIARILDPTRPLYLYLVLNRAQAVLATALRSLDKLAAELLA